MSSIKALTVIGLNSGTSMDGVDAAAFRIIPLREQERTNGHAVTQRLDVEMIDSHLYALEPELRKKMRSLTASGRGSLDDLARLNVALGEVFAEAALTLMKQARLSRSDVDLIGSHGQTIWHAPTVKKYAGISTRATMQLGEAAIIAARTGIPVISDFRVQDMARGGQGAPLVAYADEVLFGGGGSAIGVLNIGGIANLTVIDESGQATMAFDTGPGNMLIDQLSQKFFQAEFDKNGDIARSGRADQQLVDQLMKEPYFALKPPRTTGRELFGTSFLERMIAEAKLRGISDKDLVSSATLLTAKSIARAYSDFVQPGITLDTLVLGGGGADNSLLCQLLVAEWPAALKLMRHEDFGVSTKFKEALLFALLAYTTHFGIANNVPRCTGASGKVCLGKLCRP